MKRKNLLLIIPAVLLILILKSCSSSSRPVEDNSTNKQLLERIGQLEEENKKLKDQLATTNQTEPEPSRTESELNQTTLTSDSTDKTDNTNLGINDEWVVEGQWKLKILDVKTTQDRNEYSDKNPAQVVIVSYTYENIGYKDDFGDGLFMSPDQIIDANGSVGYSYPGRRTHFADEIPEGAKVDIAEEIYGLNNQSNEVSINFIQYDGNGNKQKATFKVPVN